MEARWRRQRQLLLLLILEGRLRLLAFLGDKVKDLGGSLGRGRVGVPVWAVLALVRCAVRRRGLATWCRVATILVERLVSEGEFTENALRVVLSFAQGGG